MKAKARFSLLFAALGVAAWLLTGSLTSRSHSADDPRIGQEVAIPRHLQDGEEYDLRLPELLDHGARLFSAVWTGQEGGGRPLTKGTGEPLADPSDPLVFPRNFNRISAPDANSCAGCHNRPFGVPGGGGDFVSSLFVLGQRFDFATFDHADAVLTKGSLDERGEFVTQDTIANRRASIGLFGSGYIEMLARQMTADLQAIRDATGPGESNALVSKGVDFGIIARDGDGSWDASGVHGLPEPSLVSSGPEDAPNLIIRPFQQAGLVVSLREFANNAMNHHHGVQSAERFGPGADPDGDGFADELTRADMTAVAIFQATLAVPGRVIPNHPQVEQAVLLGEQLFESIGCAGCHVPSLPLDGEVYSEPNPYNPDGNMQPGDAPALEVDLGNPQLPQPRLKAHGGVVEVPAYTDLKLHDMCYGPTDPNAEPLDQSQTPGSEAFFTGNCTFITKKLWGAANEPPFFHHGQFTTLRQAVLEHSGEAQAARVAFEGLSDYERDSVIEFLKTLQVLPPGTRHLIVDENGEKKVWPPHD
jgi:hypothetical protein